MKNKIPIEQLLKWRLAQAEAEAPPAPRAGRLLELARPWWETWPERFESLVERLRGVQVAYGHAMTESGPARTGYPVPAVIVCGNEEVETTIRVLYLIAREGRLRLRFQLNHATPPASENFEATFISDNTARPILSAQATHSVDSEFRIDAELSEELVHEWAKLKVTDRMPFRLILRTDNYGS